MSAIDFGPKAYNASGTILPHRIVAATANDQEVVQASGAATVGAQLGVNAGVQADTDYPHCDVQLNGIVRVEAGAAVSFADLLMSNASGQAIVATSGNFAILQALEDCSGAGAIIRARIIGYVAIA